MKKNFKYQMKQKEDEVHIVTINQIQIKVQIFPQKVKYIFHLRKKLKKKKIRNYLNMLKMIRKISHNSNLLTRKMI